MLRPQKAGVERIFNKLAKGAGGEIPIETLTKSLTVLGCVLTDDQIVAVHRDMDVNMDGMVTQDEFLASLEFQHLPKAQRKLERMARQSTTSSDA